MEFSHVSLEERLKCSICLDIFKDPVLLTCTHSFCRECIKRTWNQKKMKECPFCKTPIKHSLLDNQVLKETCALFIQEKKSRMETLAVKCRLHDGKQELFCVDDQQLVCLQCVNHDHQNHNFCSISKAAEKQRTELERTLQALQMKCKTLDSQKSTYKDTLVKFQSQVQQTEECIKEEFKKLHQFLREEEKAKIDALRQEEEKKVLKIKAKVSKINILLTNISEQINKIKEDLMADSSILLHNIRHTKERAKYTVTDLEVDQETVTDSVKHLGNLSYRVWEKMKDVCLYYPIILDPATIRFKLHLSQDLNSITFGLGQTPITSPTKCIQKPFILGSEGFVSGSHSWEVEVGDSKEWAIGVVKESNKAKPDLFNFALLIYMLKEKHSWNPGPANIKKICVFLDCEKRQVTFTDPDSNTTLKTHTYTHPEKMYPCFCTYSKIPMRILPAKVSVYI